jgi:hypothetical protein
LKFSLAVGFTHRQPHREPVELPGPRPVFFFAPERLRKRAVDWGRDGIDERLAVAWRDFVRFAERWLRVQRGRGPDAVRAVCAATLAGRVPPDEGHLLSLES